jgi:hypothetical protein
MLDADSYLKNGLMYIEFCERVIRVLKTFKGLAGTYGIHSSEINATTQLKILTTCLLLQPGPRYLARKPAKALLPPKCPPEYWNGVTLQMLVATSPDQRGFMQTFIEYFHTQQDLKNSNASGVNPTARDFSRHLGGLPAEEGCMYSCILKSKGVMKLPRELVSSSSSSSSSLPSGLELLKIEAASFQKRFGFDPNPAFLLLGTHLQNEFLDDKECAAVALVGK